MPNAPRHLSAARLIASDFRRYRAAGANPLSVVFLTQGFWASCVYRLAHAGRRVPIPGIRHLLIALGIVGGKWIEIIAGVSLPAAAKIGKGLYIGHFGPILVSPLATLGQHCNLSQGVTIGVAGRGEKRGAPTIGDRVYIGANAIVVGQIHIGDDAAIGAGAIVTKDVPPRGVAVGNPARILSCGGSFDFVRYDGMENDEERLAALQARDGDESANAGKHDAEYHDAELVA